MQQAPEQDLIIPVFIPERKDRIMQYPSQHPKTPVRIVNERCLLQVSEYDSLSEIRSQNLLRIVHELAVSLFPSELEPENELIYC